MILPKISAILVLLLACSVATTSGADVGRVRKLKSKSSKALKSPKSPKSPKAGKVGKKSTEAPTTAPSVSGAPSVSLPDEIDSINVGNVDLADISECPAPLGSDELLPYIETLGSLVIPGGTLKGCFAFETKNWKTFVGRFYLDGFDVFLYTEVFFLMRPGDLGLPVGPSYSSGSYQLDTASNSIVFTFF